MDDNNKDYALNDEMPPEFSENSGPPRFTKEESQDGTPPQFEKKEKSNSILNSMFSSVKKPKALGEKVPKMKMPGSKSPKTGVLLGGLIALAVLIGAASMMLFGKTSVESICSETAQNMREVESYTSTVKMDMDADVTIEGQDVDFRMDSTYETDIKLDPYTSHTVGNYIMSAAGTNESHDIEMYMKKSGKKADLYVNSEGYWLSMEDYSLSEFDVDLFNRIGKGNLDAKLADDTITIDGKEAYRLDVVLTGSDLSNCFLGETQAVLGMDYSVINWYAIEADTKIYIYKDSKLPARIDIDASDIGDIFVEQMLEAAFGTEYEYSYNINKYDVQFTYSDYNDVKTITIPSEVTSGSVSDEDEDTTVQTNAQGQYEISNKNHTVAITPIFEVQNTNTFDTYNVYLRDENGNSYSYYLHDNTTEDDYIKYYCDDSWRKESEEYTDLVLGDVQTIDVNGMQVKYIINSYTFDGKLHSIVLYAFTVLDQDILAISADPAWFDGDEEPTINEDLVRQLFENVEVK